MNSNYLPIENIHLFIWLAFMTFLTIGEQTQREEDVDGETVIRYTPFFAALVFLPVFLMVVLGRPRADMFIYLQDFQALPSGLIEGCREVFSSKGPAFTLIGVIVKTVFGTNFTIYRLVIALIHAVPVITIFRRYSDDYIFSIYLFLTLGVHLAWMMNGMRQFTAVSIVFAATPWMIEKKYVRVVLMILAAALFHKTALFMLLVIFVVQGKAWNRRTMLFSAAAVASTFFFSWNSGAFDFVAGFMGYSLEALREYGDDGANPIRVLVCAVPPVLAFIARDTLENEENRLINICVNMSVITTGVMLLATVTSGITMGRMAIYTNLYSMILLPHVIDVYFDENNAKVVKIVAVVLYFVLFYVERGL